MDGFYTPAKQQPHQQNRQSAGATATSSGGSTGRRVLRSALETLADYKTPSPALHNRSNKSDRLATASAAVRKSSEAFESTLAWRGDDKNNNNRNKQNSRRYADEPQSARSVQFVEFQDEPVQENPRSRSYDEDAWMMAAAAERDEESRKRRKERKSSSRSRSRSLSSSSAATNSPPPPASNRESKKKSKSAKRQSSSSPEQAQEMEMEDESGRFPDHYHHNHYQQQTVRQGGAGFVVIDTKDNSRTRITRPSADRSGGMMERSTPAAREHNFLDSNGADEDDEEYDDSNGNAYDLREDDDVERAQGKTAEESLSPGGLSPTPQQLERTRRSSQTPTAHSVRQRSPAAGQYVDASALGFLSPSPVPPPNARQTSPSTDAAIAMTTPSPPPPPSKTPSPMASIATELLFSEEDVQQRIRSALETYETARDEEEAHVLQEVGAEVEAQNARYEELAAELATVKEAKAAVEAQLVTLAEQCETLQQSTESVYQELLEERETSRRLEVAICHAEDSKRVLESEHKRTLEFEKSQLEVSHTEVVRKLQSQITRVESRAATQLKEVEAKLQAAEEDAAAARRQLVTQQEDAEQRQVRIAQVLKAEHEVQLRDFQAKIDEANAKAEKEVAEAAKLSKERQVEHRAEMEKLASKVQQLEADLQHQTDEVRRKMARVQNLESEKARRTAEDQNLRLVAHEAAEQQSMVLAAVEALVRSAASPVSAVASKQRTLSPAPRQQKPTTNATTPSRRGAHTCVRSAAIAAYRRSHANGAGSNSSSPSANQTSPPSASHRLLSSPLAVDTTNTFLTEGDDAVDYGGMEMLDVLGYSDEEREGSDAAAWAFDEDDDENSFEELLNRDELRGVLGQLRRELHSAANVSSSSMTAAQTSGTPTPHRGQSREVRRGQLVTRTTLRLLRRLEAWVSHIQSAVRAFSEQRKRDQQQLQRLEREVGAAGEQSIKREKLEEKQQRESNAMRAELQVAIATAVKAAEAASAESLAAAEKRADQYREKARELKLKLAEERQQYEDKLEKLLQDDSHEQALRKVMQELDHTRAQLRVQREELSNVLEEREQWQSEYDAVKAELKATRAQLTSVEEEAKQQTTLASTSAEAVKEAAEKLSAAEKRAAEATEAKDRLQARVARLMEQVKTAELSAEERQNDVHALQLRVRTLESNLRTARGAAAAAVAASSKASSAGAASKNEKQLDAVVKELTLLRETQEKDRAASEKKASAEKDALQLNIEKYRKQLVEIQQSSELRRTGEETTLRMVIEQLEPVVAGGATMESNDSDTIHTAAWQLDTPPAKHQQKQQKRGKSNGTTAAAAAATELHEGCVSLELSPSASPEDAPRRDPRSSEGLSSSANVDGEDDGVARVKKLRKQVVALVQRAVLLISSTQNSAVDGSTMMTMMATARGKADTAAPRTRPHQQQQQQQQHQNSPSVSSDLVSFLEAEVEAMQSANRSAMKKRIQEQQRQQSGTARSRAQSSGDSRALPHHSSTFLTSRQPPSVQRLLFAGGEDDEEADRFLGAGTTSLRNHQHRASSHVASSGPSPSPLRPNSNSNHHPSHTRPSASNDTAWRLKVKSTSLAPQSQPFHQRKSSSSSTHVNPTSVKSRSNCNASQLQRSPSAFENNERAGDNQKHDDKHYHFTRDLSSTSPVVGPGKSYQYAGVSLSRPRPDDDDAGSGDDSESSASFPSRNVFGEEADSGEGNQLANRGTFSVHANNNTSVNSSKNYAASQHIVKKAKGNAEVRIVHAQGGLFGGSETMTDAHGVNGDEANPPRPPSLRPAFGCRTATA